MSIDRDLLRRAWPDGFLSARGVRTIGGWTCLGRVLSADKFWKQADFWSAPDMTSLYGRVCSNGEIVGYGSASPFNVTPWVDARRTGDLLPRVDPEDVATWACLLDDLARAADLPTEGRRVAFEKTAGCRRLKSWVVHSASFGVPRDTRSMPLGMEDIFDPAEALVRARVRLREVLREAADA